MMFQATSGKLWPARKGTPGQALRRRRASGLRGARGTDISFAGLIFLFMMLFMASAAVHTRTNILYAVAGLMIGVLLVSFRLSRFVLKKLRVRRVLPDTLMVGQRAALTFECANHKRFWPSLSVTVAELNGSEAFVKPPLAYLLHAAAGAHVVIGTELMPRRRGLYAFDEFQVRTSFPFGFIRRAQRHRQPETFIVFPAIGRVKPGFLEACRSAESSGIRLRPTRGGDDEFYGVKEFRSGENPRLIYWRRSARTGVLVSKEMTLVSPPRLLLLVDTCLKSRSVDQHVLVEKTIAMAASLASHALEVGLLVGVYAWSGGWMGLAPNRGKRHRQDVLGALARLALNENYNADQLLDHSRQFLRGGTTPILLTPHATETSRGNGGRGGPLVISPSLLADSQWFQFDPEVDFAVAMPLEQQPPPEVGQAGAAKV